MGKRKHEQIKQSFKCVICQRELPRNLIWWRKNKYSNKVLPFCESCLTSNGKKRFKVYENELRSHTILHKNLALILVPKNRSTQPKRKHCFYLDVVQLCKTERTGRNHLPAYCWRVIARFYKPIDFNRMIAYVHSCKKYPLGLNCFKIRRLQISPGKFRLRNVVIPGLTNERGHFALKPYNYGVWYGQNNIRRPE
jgi:hypothetical protein